MGDNEFKKKPLLNKVYYEKCPGCYVDKKKELQTGLPIKEVFCIWIVALSVSKQLLFVLLLHKIIFYMLLSCDRTHICLMETHFKLLKILNVLWFHIFLFMCVASKILKLMELGINLPWCYMLEFFFFHFFRLSVANIFTLSVPLFHGKFVYFCIFSLFPVFHILTFGILNHDLL